MTPIELLKDKLYEFEKALQKSFQSFKAGQITKELHETHQKNLEPLIFQYKQAINYLNEWMI
jgi:hypothetical protein